MDTNSLARFESDASEALDGMIDRVDFGGTQVHVLFGYHQSDIGKAELIARLGVLLGGGDHVGIVKVDGFLNTNNDGSHPSRTRNDFVVYRRFHPHIQFGGPSLILSGPLLLEFLQRFGECREHLMFRPHVAQFFLRRIFDNWCSMARPAHLLIEIGGNLLDVEVQAYVAPAVRLLSELSAKVHLLLLAEAGYNREVVKARPIVNALECGRHLGLTFKAVVARLPADTPMVSDFRALNSYLRTKVARALVSTTPPNIVAVPYYLDAPLTGYVEHLAAFRDELFLRTHFELGRPDP